MARLLIVLLTFVSISCSLSEIAYAQKPNIVLINVDDLGWKDLTCQGSQYYETPNLDKFASQSMTFTNAYAGAANCAPSRACMLTGQNTPRHGIYTVGNSDRGKPQDRKLIPTKNITSIEDDNLTIAHFLKPLGYTCCTVGKWHISSDPLKNGFDINIAGGHWGSPSKGGYHSPYNFPNCEQKKPGEYLTDRLTDEAIGFIEKHKAGPFFLYLPFYTVHTPLQAKKEKKQKYENKPGTEAHKNPTYAAMIESMDENVGRLLKSIDDHNLTENTIVIFTSDNGGIWATSKQWPLRAGKGAYYEGGIREPLFIRWPNKIKAGSKCDVPVTNLDFFPTILEATGVKKKEKLLDGVSLMPLLTQSGTIPERPLYWHFPIYLQAYAKNNPDNRDVKFRTRPGSVIRYGEWKLHEYFEDNGLELYNLRTDVGEKNNVASKNPEKVKELHAMLKQWRKETNAPVPTELNPKYVP
jgi:arylsulfatase A-like enzyme